MPLVKCLNKSKIQIGGVIKVNPMKINEELRTKLKWHRLESTNGSVTNVLKVRALQENLEYVS
jgi:hypothetical protein